MSPSVIFQTSFGSSMFLQVKDSGGQDFPLNVIVRMQCSECYDLHYTQNLLNSKLTQV